MNNFGHNLRDIGTSSGEVQAFESGQAGVQKIQVIGEGEKALVGVGKQDHGNLMSCGFLDKMTGQQ